MFDFNGDGDVDAEEFDQVALLLRQNTVLLDFLTLFYLIILPQNPYNIFFFI